MTEQATRFSAVVLSGGTGTRLGGVDKASLRLRDRPLLAWVLDALAEADEVAVVGDPVATERPVAFTREDPPHGGPAAGLLAGLDALTARPAWLAVVAVDMPQVRPETFRRLLVAAQGHDGAFLTDDAGARQLCGVLDVRRLAAVRPEPPATHNLSVRRLLAPLRLVAVTGEGTEAQDVDTWGDLRDLS